MSDCPRCGRPLDPDAARCLACVHGPFRVGPRRFRRDPVSAWTWRAFAVGAALGGVVGTVVAVALAIQAAGFGAGGVSGFALWITALAVTGGTLCAAAVLVWGTLRP